MSFRSPFVDCKICNPKTGRVAYLSLFGGDETFPYVQSVALNMARNVNLGMTITLSPPYQEAIKLISKDSEWLRLGNTIGMRWGYADMEGVMSDWHYAFMNQPQISFGEDITISIEATSLAWHMDRVSRSRDWASTESPKSILAVILEIADRYGMDVEYAVLKPSAKSLLEFERSSLVQGGRTDMQFLMYEVERCGARVIIQNQKIILIDTSAPLEEYPKVNATFGFYTPIDVTNNILPMMSFSSESMGALFIRNVNGIKSLIYGINSDPGKEQEDITADETTTEENSFSSKTTYGPQDTDGNEPKQMGDVKTKSSIKVDPKNDEGGRVYAPALSGEESDAFVQQQLAAIYDDQGNEHGIIAKFSCIAIPNLLPGMYVKILGVGDYFSSIYMLNEIQLSIDGNGAMMECEGFSRGFPAVDPELDAIANQATKSDEPPDGTLDELFLG